MTEKLKIAIQKSGRLNEGSLKLLKDCGINVENGDDKLKVAAGGFPLEVIFLRNSDIPQYVADGVVHLGIVGENELMESDTNVRIIQKLGFSRCRLSIAVPKESDYYEKNWLSGKRIATSYPIALTRFLNENGIKAEIHLINGSVEIAPTLGLADAVCDLVSSGNTLFSNGLKEAEVLLNSEAVVIQGNMLSNEINDLTKRLMFRIDSVLNARKYKYVLLNSPEDRIEEIVAILQGMKSPTILPLAKKGWISLHSVVAEDVSWGIVDQLKDKGAEGILVIPIEKMIF